MWTYFTWKSIGINVYVCVPVRNMWRVDSRAGVWVRDGGCRREVHYVGRTSQGHQRPGRNQSPANSVFCYQQIEPFMLIFCIYAYFRLFRKTPSCAETALRQIEPRNWCSLGKRLTRFEIYYLHFCYCSSLLNVLTVFSIWCLNRSLFIAFKNENKLLNKIYLNNQELVTYIHTYIYIYIHTHMHTYTHTHTHWPLY